MSEPFIAEIKIVAFDFPPKGWALCDGQILPINQNQSLYSIIGTTYGGDGRTTFALPDLRGRTPIHFDPGHPLGQKGGEETHTLQVSELPMHDHVLQASSTDGNNLNVTNNLLAREVGGVYRPDTNNPAQMPAAVIANAGGSQAHENMQPYLTLNFVIALKGLFPSRN